MSTIIQTIPTYNVVIRVVDVIYSRQGESETEDVWMVPFKIVFEVIQFLQYFTIFII